MAKYTSGKLTTRDKRKLRRHYYRAARTLTSVRKRIVPRYNTTREINKRLSAHTKQLGYVNYRKVFNHYAEPPLDWLYSINRTTKLLLIDIMKCEPRG